MVSKQVAGGCAEFVMRRTMSMESISNLGAHGSQQVGKHTLTNVTMIVVFTRPAQKNAL